MKQAVTNCNITEYGCMKSPVSTISCRSLQHACFVHVAKIDWSFPCISMTKKKKKKIQEYCSSLSLSSHLCVCVCVWRGEVGWVGGCMCGRERESEREEEAGQRGYKEAEAAPLAHAPPSPPFSLSVFSAAGLPTGQSSNDGGRRRTHVSRGAMPWLHKTASSEKLMSQYALPPSFHCSNLWF